MSLKILFSVYGVYTILMGASFVLMPSMVMKGAGMEPTADLLLTQQIWGAALLGIGLVAWSLRGADENDALKGTVMAMAELAAIAAVVTIYHIVAKGVMGPPVILNLVVQLAAAGGIFLKIR